MWSIHTLSIRKCSHQDTMEPILVPFGYALIGGQLNAFIGLMLLLAGSFWIYYHFSNIYQIGLLVAHFGAFLVWRCSLKYGDIECMFLCRNSYIDWQEWQGKVRINWGNKNSTLKIWSSTVIGCKLFYYWPYLIQVYGVEGEVPFTEVVLV